MPVTLTSWVLHVYNPFISYLSIVGFGKAKGNVHASRQGEKQVVMSLYSLSRSK